MTAGVRALTATLLVAAGAAVLVTQPLKGAILVTVTAHKGLDTGDLLVVPFLAAAFAVVAPFLRLPRHPGSADPAAVARRRMSIVPVGAAVVALGLVRLPDVTGPERPGPVLVVAALLVSSVAASSALLGGDGFRVVAVHAPRFAAALAALVAGYLLDTALVPNGTALGPLGLALFVAVTRRPDPSARHWFVLAALLTAVNAAAVADVAGLDVALAAEGGGPTRTIALGALLALGGVADYVVARHRPAAAGLASDVTG